MKTIAAAQTDMRSAYFSGAPGIIASGTAWLVAALFALTVSARAGILALVFGGMLIFPVSVVLCKILGCSGKHSKDNPLAALAIEGTLWMLLCIPVAVGAALYRAQWFFPAMLFVIAGRYLTFATLYGLRLYWLFAAVLAIAGWVAIILKAPVFSGAFTGALVEYCFGIVIYTRHKSGQKNT